MSDLTSIEWTDWTWNPLGAFLKEAHTVTLKDGSPRTFAAGTRGWFCTKVSPGCLHCYAERINLRLGNGLEYVSANLDKIEWRLVNLLQPLSKRVKGGRNRVFVNSMTDLFHDAVPEELIDQVFAVMALARQWDFQVLTKRARRMREYFNAPGRAAAIKRAISVLTMQHKQVEVVLPLPNVWLGVSAEDQTRAEQRIPDLLRCPAVVRFVSAEPLMGPIDFEPYCYVSREGNTCVRCGFMSNCDKRCPNDGEVLVDDYGIDWLILGGESGLGSRGCDVDALRSALQQAQAAGVAVMVKQLGKAPFCGRQPNDPRRLFPKPGNWSDGKFLPALDHAKGGDPAEWPEDLRVREFPGKANSQPTTI